MSAMVRENVLMVFFNPNGITFHSYKLDLVIIVFFFTSSGAIRICQNLDYKSNAETIGSALMDSKHLQSEAWEKNPALFENLMGDSVHKIFGYHLFSLVKSPYKHILMHFYASFPNALMLTFVNSLQLPPNKIAIQESCDREVVLGCQ
jgi:hypothetical protein